ncbi:hypothetical protein BYT27DRAFT_7341887 [Phlegmacium glaucopus]|nr:hypothetical protein BYT27DRAFT_7341887 [Phlegmacium glaucopus]
MHLPNLPVVLAFQIACFVTLGCTARNISIDDQDPLFVYTGTWQRLPDDVGMDQMGGHMLAESPDAFATITYTFASVYFLSPLWPYKVTTEYGIDGSEPIKIDLQDYSRNSSNNGVATVASNVVGQWLSTVNKQHTIRISVPPGDKYAVVDMFTFVVLDPSNISSTTSSTSTTSSSTQVTSSTGTTSLQAVVSSTSSSSSSLSPSSSSSGSPGTSKSNQVRNLVIAMAVLGTSVALIIILLLWWFYIHRKNKNKTYGNISPHYHPLPTENMTISPFTGYDDQSTQNNNAGVFATPMREGPILATGHGANVPFTDNSSWIRFDDASSHGGIQSIELQQNPNNLNYYPQTSSYNGVIPSTFYSNQGASSLPLSLPPPLPLHPLTPLPTQNILRNRQGPLSTFSMSDSPPMYTRDSDTSPDSSVMWIGKNDANSLLDESGRSMTAAPSSNGKTNEKTRGKNQGPSSRILPIAQYTPGADPAEASVLSTAMPEGNQARNSVWDSGYPQPLRFIPIT